ncbi:hypothetical protein F5Y00DRAFT_240710 [Daldinia vernicosa]|uniref:uncharacterized protein n=1 Tax=Daldinia vernicosa TaxID=114800 RepID=UPI002008D7D8|nr:uncharacterized protein F5Y00DRAFT_240710 [Daldinia vernicosa]KAI0847632.1 hypothetical protein F5Y00DRAFT_240710 [Daldinia vernicosa]
MTSLHLARPLGKLRLPHYGLSHYGQYVSLQRWMSNERALTDERRPKRPQSSTFSSALGGSTSEGEIQPGDHIVAFCRKYQVSFPSVLRRVSGFKLTPNPFELGVLISEKHCFTKNSLRYLDKYEQPFTKSVLEMYIAQKKQPLWYSVHSAGTTSPLPGRVSSRRIRHAFRDALAARGYDREGRKIMTDDSNIADLHGTVHIYCANPKAACNLKFPELVKQTNKIVSAIEPMLARDKDGKRIHVMQSYQRPGNQYSESARRFMDNRKLMDKKKVNTNTQYRSRAK